MDTTDFADVLAEAASEAGTDASNISTAEFLVWRRLAKRRLETAWRYHLWPDLGRCEQRFYRLAWNSTATYAAAVPGVDNSANEVWWALTGQYFVALTAVPANTPPTDTSGNIDLAHWGFTAQFAIQPDPTGSLNNWPDNPAYPLPYVSVQSFDPTATYNQGDRVQYQGNVYQLFALTATGDLPTDTANWGLIPPFDSYVPYEQTSQTPFTVVEEVYSANPRITTRGNTLNYFLSERGVQVVTPIAFAWIQFRLRCPKLNGLNYSASTTYAAGAQFYYSSAATPGNFFTVNSTMTAGDTPDSAPGEFTVVGIPRIFHRYLVLGMAADWFKDEAKKNPELGQQMGLYQAQADAELEDAKSSYVAQMGQRMKTQVRTR